MLLVACNLVIQAAWSGYRQLNQFPFQAFSVENICQRADEALSTANGNLTHWGRMGSISMYAVNAEMTQDHHAESFLDKYQSSHSHT